MSQEITSHQRSLRGRRREDKKGVGKGATSATCRSGKRRINSWGRTLGLLLARPDDWPRSRQTRQPPKKWQSVQASLRADSAMKCRCRAEECWSQCHHVRRLVSPIKPLVEPRSRQPPLSPSSPASPNDKLMTRTAPMCNRHPLRRYGSIRPIGAPYPSVTHNVSFIPLKRELVGRLME